MARKSIWTWIVALALAFAFAVLIWATRHDVQLKDDLGSVVLSGDQSNPTSPTYDLRATRLRLQSTSDAGIFPATSPPNIVTRIDGAPLYKAPIEKRLPHLAKLRSLAEVGWSEAALVLAPIVARCISYPPKTEAEILAANNPATMIRFGDQKQWAEMSPEERTTERERWSRRAEQIIEQERFRPEQCRLAQPEDPDRLMDWLEQALLEQPPDFFRVLLEEPWVPSTNAWVVRNAERLSVFNDGVLAAVRSNVARGDRELLARAWSFFADGRFQPEPDPLTAAVYANAASHLPPHERHGRFDAAWMDAQFGDALGENQLERAAELGAELYDRCCADARMPS